MIFEHETVSSIGAVHFFPSKRRSPRWSGTVAWLGGPLSASLAALGHVEVNGGVLVVGIGRDAVHALLAAAGDVLIPPDFVEPQHRVVVEHVLRTDGRPARRVAGECPAAI